MTTCHPIIAPRFGCVSRVTSTFISACALLTTSHALAEKPCEPEWVATVGRTPGIVGIVLSMFAHDDGAGPALYVGGAIQSAGGTPVSSITRWDGSNWVALGDGTNGNVWSILGTHEGPDDGPALYAGGSFTSAGGGEANSIARWDGNEWHALGSGTDGLVRAMAVFDNGSGPVLYAGGTFTTAGTIAANNVARWDGISWSPLGDGLNGSVFALTLHDDGFGDGPALYAGGSFTVADDITVNGIARWNGTSWSPLGRGVDTNVWALISFDDGHGSGPALYAGGDFSTAGDVNASRIARWNGQQWEQVGSGLQTSVRSLAVHDDGQDGGPTLRAAGGPGLIIETADGVAEWTGSQWIPSGDGFAQLVVTLASFHPSDETDPELYAGGFFSFASFQYGSREMARISRLRHGQWQPVGRGFSRSMEASDFSSCHVFALSSFDDGSDEGESLYAAGWFASVDSVTARNIVRWNDGEWTPLSSGLNATVYDLVVHDDGSGDRPALYAGGLFNSAGGIDAVGVARWDGEEWSPVGSGLGGFWGGVLAMTVFDDGKGNDPVLIAGGVFTTIGGVQFNRIAQWDGRQWSPLGSGVNGLIWSMGVFDDGNGPALYVGGDFTEAGGLPANRIAKWDGAEWSPMGSGMNSRVNAIASFDDGSGDGPRLIVSGQFSTAGGVPVRRIAQWQDGQWLSMESDGDARAIFAMTNWDDGTGAGPSLYVGGVFTEIGGVHAPGIARWDGRSWSAVGSGIEVQITPLHGAFAIATLHDGQAEIPSLFVGGNFRDSASGDGVLARWQGCAHTPSCAPEDLNCDGTIDLGDLLVLLQAWGPCPDMNACPADLNGDGVVDLSDLLILLRAWE